MQATAQQVNVAENIVKHSLRIRHDDVVQIAAAQHMLGLADEIAKQCRVAGAETTTSYWSESLWLWSIGTLPKEWLSSPNKVDLAMLDVATALVGMTSTVDPTPMSRIPGDRWAANSDGADPFYRKSRERKLRTVNLNSSLVTPQRAAVYGFPFKEWQQSVEDSLATDFGKLRTVGSKLTKEINGSTAEVQITAKNGTSLTFKFAGRKCKTDDGVIDDEDLADGNFETTLPAGDLRVAPEEESANGRVTFDLPVHFAGRDVENVNWVLKNGNVTEFTATRNGDQALDMWKKSSGDKSRFGWFRVGFNPAAKAGFTDDPIVSGAVTLGIGENTDLGGKNQSNYGFQGTISKATVAVGGRVIIRDGKLEL